MKKTYLIGLMATPIFLNGAINFFDDGTSDENWNTAANWSTGYLPGENTDAVKVIGGQVANVFSDTANFGNSYSVYVSNSTLGATMNVDANMYGINTIHVAADLPSAALGNWIQTNGDISASGLKIGGSNGGDALFLIAGGSLSLSGNIELNGSGSLSLQQDDAEITASAMTTANGSTLEFIAGPTGLNAIDLSGALTITSGTTLKVDAGFYTGGSATIELIKFPSGQISGSFSSISIEGLEGLYSGAITTDADSVNLVVSKASMTTQYYYNSTGDSQWTTAGNWSNQSVPGATTRGMVNNGRTAEINTDISNFVQEMAIGNNALSNTTLEVGADAEVNDLNVGFNSAGIGHVNQVAGDFVVNRALNIAASNGTNTGSYTMTGGSLQFPYATLQVGTSGAGDFTVEGVSPDAITGADLKVGSQGTLNFNFDKAGVTPIELEGFWEVETGGKIVVDGSAFKGYDCYFPLIRGGELVGSFDSSTMLDVQGFVGLVKVVVDDGLWLRLMPEPLFSPYRFTLTTSLIPASSVSANTSSSNFSLTRSLDLSGSSWTPDFSENYVMCMRMSHDDNSSSATDLSWDLRIGQGGQIYSFRTDELGELVPPQSYGDNSPWIDSVWQGVAVDSTKSSLGDYFIHQAGVYTGDPDFMKEPFFSPMLAATTSISGRNVAVVNWGQQAHVGNFTDTNTANDFQSHLLFYNHYEDIGDGVIEVTLGLYNFGPDTMQHMNLPWGGVRRTSLAYGFLSDTNGTTAQLIDGNNSDFTDNIDTGGWVAYSNSDTTSGSSPSLGVVFGYGDSPFGAGTANRNALIRHLYYPNGATPKPDELAWRNGFLFTSIRKFDLTGGNGVWYRYYFVLGSSVDDVSSKIDSKNLVSNAELLPFSYTESAPKVGYSYTGSGSTFALDEDTGSHPDFRLFAHPVDGSSPIFEITEKDGSTYLTWDPYATGVVKTYDGTIAGMKLLGFALPSAGTSYTYQLLSSLVPSANYEASGKSLYVPVY